MPFTSSVKFVSREDLKGQGKRQFNRRWTGINADGDEKTKNRGFFNRNERRGDGEGLRPD
jgi:hypothetical protein